MVPYGPLAPTAMSPHALPPLGRRQITLTQPARTENDEVDPTLVHALRPIPEKGFQVLRVIYNETTDPVTVVTAYFDNEVKDL